MAACTLTAAGLAFAGGSNVFVTFETGPDLDPCDAPDYCVVNNFENVSIPGDCTYVNGQLEKRPDISCEPDTYLVLFNKLGEIVNFNDNGSPCGNGWASALYDVNFSNGIIANGDGTFSLRIGVTGRPDGLDGNFNGFFQNAPHGQLGCWTLHVTFDVSGAPDVEEWYADEFVTGAEAFHVNYTVPANTVNVDIEICNDTHCDREKRVDVDIFRLTNLVPFCDYCIEQIGGIDCECNPTDTRLGWFDKSCDLIFSEDEGGEVTGYAKLCVVADVNGHIILGVTGGPDTDFDGLCDSFVSRAPVECPEPTCGHGVAGCYTLKVYVTKPHTGGSEPDAGSGASGDVAALELALDHGDLNRDGVTNTADLGIMLGSFGWIQ
jgi:hypothetical protein